ncbi:MAG: glycosyltransferase family 2 protein [Acidobacteriota bacterium]|jgi:GT2 family glycosyltransferase
MTPDLTVIIINHNTREDLLACVDSLPAAAASLRLQVIVVDNASIDGSVAAVERRFPTVRVLALQTNSGFARGCNLGIAEARAPFVAVLNADIVCDPGALQAMVRFLRGAPRAAAVGPLLCNSDGSLQTSAYRFPTLPVEIAGIFGVRRMLPLSALRRSRLRKLLPDTGHFDPHDRARPVDYVTGAMIALRREAVEAVRGFDENFFMYYEEIDLCRRLCTAGWQVFHLPEASATHHLNRSGTQRPRLTFLARQQSRLRYHAKHRGRLASGILRAVLATKVAGTALRLRLSSPARSGTDVDADCCLQVLRWCCDPRSLPAGRPRVQNGDDERPD